MNAEYFSPLLEKGVTASKTSMPDRSLNVQCDNGDFKGLVITFDEYLNNDHNGKVTYRVDGGETKNRNDCSKAVAM